jgi:hypothetical protein
VQLTTEYPSWLVLFCVLLAACGSWVLYKNSKLDLSGKFGKMMGWGLMLFRFLSIFFIAFLFLGPLIKMINRKTEKPFIILALDNSESIISNKDSAFYRKDFPSIIQKIKNELQGEYDVKTYTFGKKFEVENELDFKEKQTDISSVFDEINNAYSNQNLGAIILATDGIYNEGNNPLYSSKELKAPVFTIALGDTNQHKDLLIKNVKHNQLVFQGNMSPLQIDVNAFGCANQNATLTVEHNGQTVFTKSIAINAQIFFTSIPLEVDAKESGMQHYIITLSKLTGEVTYANNRADVFVNVINGKQKILLLAQSPHPDLAAYKQAIESNENYQVVLKFINDFNPQNLSEYNLAILHQLPGLRGEGNGIIKQLKDKKIPLLYVLGSQTGINVLNTIENSLNISTNQINTNDVLPEVNPSFSLFTLSEDELSILKKFPPLQSPYGRYNIRGESSVLFKQQIGYVKTDFPLIFFSKNAENKVGFICGEGFWKWRLYDAELSKMQVSQNLVSKMVQYLASKEDKSLFRITNTKKRFDENEAVQFDAEVYNESYELINTPEVQMAIKNSQGKTFNYTFSKTEKAYSLNAGLLPIGNYTYDATVNIGNNTERLKGTFTVMPFQVEFLQTVADHQLLNQLSAQSEGKLFYPTQADELIKTIKQNASIKPVIYKQEEVKSWINLKWIFFIVLSFLTVEWFVRKWNGSV